MYLVPLALCLLASSAALAQTMSNANVGFHIPNHRKTNWNTSIVQNLNMLDHSLPGMSALPALTHAGKQIGGKTGGSIVVTAAPGIDIGAQLNAAIASLSGTCGEVLIPPGMYTQTTAVVKPRCVNLHGTSAQSTILNWLPASGFAIVAADTLGNFEYPEGAISDLTLSTKGGSTTNPPGSRASVTAASQSATTVTIRSTLNPGKGTNNIFMFGWTPSDYNGVWSVTSSNPTSFQFTAPSGLGTATTLGTVTTLPRTGGIFIGGDPGGLISSSSAYGDHQNFNRLRVYGFGTAIEWGNNSWSDTVLQSVITGNTIGLRFPSNATNAGESLSIIGTSTQNNTVALNLLGGDVFFFASRCDNNVTCGNVQTAHFYGEHFEQLTNTILTITGPIQPSVEIYGGSALLTAGSGTDSHYFYVNSNLNPTFVVDGTDFLANHGITNLVSWNGSGGGNGLLTLHLSYHPTVSSIVDRPCTFIACTIDDPSGGTHVINGTLVLGTHLSKPALTGVTETITGTALAASCNSGTARVPGATTGMPVVVSSVGGIDIGGAFSLRGAVTAENIVTVYVCGTGTPPSFAYNVRVIQ